MNNHIPMNVASSREKCRERHSQQDWQQEPQQDWPQEEDSSPSPLGTLSKVQKTGPIDRGIVISASIAALLLIGGGVLSYIFTIKEKNSSNGPIS